MNLRLPDRITLLLLLLLSSLLLVSCSNNTHTKTLSESLKQYEAFIRWSQWDGAIEFMAPEYLATSPITTLDMDRLRLFRVTQYNVRSSIPFDGGTGLRQNVEIRMFNRNRAVEVALVDQQEWRYNAERERWYLHSGLPDVTRAR